MLRRKVANYLTLFIAGKLRIQVDGVCEMLLVVRYLYQFPLIYSQVQAVGLAHDLDFLHAGTLDQVDDFGRQFNRPQVYLSQLSYFATGDAGDAGLHHHSPYATTPWIDGRRLPEGPFLGRGALGPLAERDR